MTNVYIKLQSHSDSDGLTKNIIPLKVNSVGISVSKQIPALPVPLSGVTFGESITAALDLGMASKQIQIQGIIMDTAITKTFDGVDTTVTMTAHEIAQLIAAGVDATGFAENQAFNEIVILMPSFIKDDYTQRAGVDVNDRSTGTLVPFNFSSRGARNSLDNKGVPIPFSSFPDSSSDTGITGFIRSFSCNIEGDSFELSFSLDFEAATIFP
tara:strand:- start:2845 stop:3480 length:636 start_codon:yes stop_codon:yes gene_type:complete